MAALLPTGPVVRWLHVLAIATLFGGTALVWWLVRQGAADPVPTGRAYEWLFWTAVGVVVLTGVGNAGTVAPALATPASAWSRTFSLKLLAVTGLLVGSTVRTLVVVALDGPGESAPDGPGESASGDDRRGRTVRLGYVATGWYLAGLVALGEVLAHG